MVKERINRGDQICIFRFKPTIENIVMVNQMILNRSINNNDSAINIRFLKNINMEYWNINDLYNCYYNPEYEIKDEELKNYKLNHKGPFENLKNIDFNNEIFYIFELIYSENIDETIFQYLFCCMELLLKRGKRFSILISEYNANMIPQPIKYNNKLRTFFSGFFLLLGKKRAKDKKEICCEFTDKINMFCRYSDEQKWTRIIANEEEDIGRLLPVIPITEKTYIGLMQKNLRQIKKCKSVVATFFNKIYKRYCDKILSKAKNLFNNDKYKEFVKYLKQNNKADSCVESIIFISTLYYMCFEGKKDIDLTEEKISIIHEKCSDFSQGISQLIENSYYHVVLKKDEPRKSCKGCANFTIRIRKKEDAKNLYLKDLTAFSNVNYFMEIYITDLQYETFYNIKEKWLKNVEIKNKSWGEKLKDVKLIDIFDGKSQLLNEYLSQPENIAHHYGLQILNNVVKTAGGCFFVISGGEIYFSDAGNQRYYSKGMPKTWTNGTAYIICLPIKEDENIDYKDSLVNYNNAIDKTETISVIDMIKSYSAFGIDKCVSSKHKEEFIKQYKENFKDQVWLKNAEKENIYNEAQDIYVVDCSDLKNILEYEILAKSFFECFADLNFETEEKTFIPKNIALINVENEYLVTKIFRQFALFYNRVGENKYMDNRRIFIVDKEAKLDIFLKGSLKTIKENMFMEQITGGLNESAIQIINNLGTR